MKKYNRFIVFLLFIQLLSLDAYAQCGLYQIHLDQKVKESESIIEGEVIQQQSFKSTIKNKIFTLNTIKVLSVLKGNLPQQINIITAGGSVGNQMEFASSLISLKKGQVGMFFLTKETHEHKPFQTDVYSVFASWQGFYNYNLNEEAISEVYNNYNYNQFYKLLEDKYNLKVKQLYYPLIWGNNNSANRLTVINNFLPLTVNAGIGEQITINGFGFGNARGESKVLFRNANDGGLTEIEAESSQYISWADNKIVVAVSHQAGSGKIALVVGGNRTQSSAALQINFAIINTGSQNLVNPSRLVARNANKGYIWNMNAEFDADSAAKSNFLISFKKWRCKTYINWTIGNNTSINYSERDTLSVITFDENNELPLGVLGLCYSYYSGCTEDDWYIEEQDMLFRKSDKWHFGDQTIPTNKIDFQSVVLHELGHAHQLAHVIKNTDLMHYSISNGEQKRSIENVNLEAAQWLMNKSLESDICDKKRMQLLDSELCNDENFGFFNTVIYPNPFNDFLNIDFYLTKNDRLKIDLCDLNGKLIVQYENGNAQKGFLPVVFNVPNHTISAGVYILKMEIGAEKMVKKVVKQ
jgi:hypothetical protein